MVIMASFSLRMTNYPQGAWSGSLTTLLTYINSWKWHAVTTKD